MTSKKTNFIKLATEQAEHFQTMEALLARVENQTPEEQKTVELALTHLRQSSRETDRTLERIATKAKGTKFTECLDQYWTTLEKLL